MALSMVSGDIVNDKDTMLRKALLCQMKRHSHRKIQLVPEKGATCAKKSLIAKAEGFWVRANDHFAKKLIGKKSRLIFCL